MVVFEVLLSVLILNYNNSQLNLVPVLIASWITWPVSTGADFGCCGN